MKFVITGSTGHISKPLTDQLVKAGHDVTVVSSSPDRKAAIEALGAKAAIGSVEDAAFLTKTFAGADAVYTMVPPNYGAADMPAFIATTGEAYATAIKNSGVKKVVNLSSIGAEQPSGTGPISGLHEVEKSLDGLEGVNVKHVRAGFFYVNFLNDIPMIKNMKIMGANYPATTTMIMVHPADIAEVIAEELQAHFTGKSIRYIISDEKKVSEVVAIIAETINQPGLPWVEFTDEQSFEGMKGAGFAPQIAATYTEMGKALRTGLLSQDYTAKN
ncbi:MAG: NAD-dependent dehydratase, partial [Chitinophagaceae bacterium]